MNIKKPIRTIISIVLVFFLFAPIVIRSLDTDLGAQSKAAGLAKSSSTPTKADSQMPLEEKEKEEGADHSLIQLPLIYILTEYISFIPERTKNYPDVHFSGFYGNTPLYLAKRSILI
jgi:hypothetical protein